MNDKEYNEIIRLLIKSYRMSTQSIIMNMKNINKNDLDELVWKTIIAIWIDEEKWQIRIHFDDNNTFLVINI